MRLNRFNAMSIPQNLVLALLIATFMVFAPSVLAQNANPSPDPELKLHSIKIEVRASIKIDVESIPSNNNLRPTEVFAYRPEFGNAPKAGDQYSQYIRRPARNLYAVLRLTNESAKTIKSIDWEYTSPHYKGNKLVLYQQASTHMKIGSGQMATLSKKLPQENKCGIHFGVIFGQQTLGKGCGWQDKKWTGMHLVEARLLKITYEDGTVWKL
jgi:hypothetical protein